MPLFRITCPAAKFLHEVLQQSGSPLQPRTAKAIIPRVEAYAVEVGYPGPITEAMIQRAVSQPRGQRSKTPKRTWFVKVLQEHIAELVCQEDQMLLDLAWLIHERGLPSRRINPKTGRILRTRMGFPKPVLRAKQALSNLRSWRVPFDFVVDAETIWRYSEKYGGLSAGVNRLGRSREIICAS